ncbi:MAG: nuclear transport factor 2 family protein [Deltaproteobacteria bacterium]|jgi:ketosteroid isomerase-like protein|nr:nuclear transport factor 2 family protein [Deltaproteobacteria bacterium]
MTTNPTTVALDSDLNQQILSGKALDAFDQYYASHCVMQEGTGEPRVGKEANRKYEEDFFGSVAEVHNVELVGSAVSGDRSYSEWIFDVTFKNGERVKLTQTAVRQWKDGKIEHERFYSA